MIFSPKARSKHATGIILGVLFLAVANAALVCAASLDAADPEERFDALTALSADMSIEACTALMSALADKDDDLRDRAARAAYSCVHTHNETTFALGLALSHGLSLGSAAAQSYLLVATDPIPSAVSLLRKTLAADDPPMVKLVLWLPPIPASLPAAVALSRLGDLAPLRRLTQSPETDEWIFFLSVLSDITDPISLRSLAKAFASQQPIPGGVPSHAKSGRRLVDLAVESFAKRFDLDPGMPLNQAQAYSAEVIADIRRKTASSLTALEDR